jgi:hypothetical protein
MDWSPNRNDSGRSIDEYARHNTPKDPSLRILKASPQDSLSLLPGIRGLTVQVPKAVALFPRSAAASSP